MNAGSYRKRIKIQKLSVSENANGFETEEWTDFYGNYAYVNQLSGTEFWQAAEVKAHNTVKFTLRWHKKLDQINTKQFRIKMGERIFNITNVDNVMLKNETVKLSAVEVI